MHAVSLTLNEAGYVVGQTRAAINRAVDRGIIDAKHQVRGKNRLRKVGRAELRFLAIAGAVEKDLTPAGRRKVYEAMRRLPADAQRLHVGVLEFTLTDIDRDITERLGRLEALNQLVKVDAKGDLVIRGTDLSVYAVAALASGQSVAEIIDDIPGLTAVQIKGAAAYADVYPRSGRPLPTRTLKRQIVEMAEKGVWDVDDAVELTAPRAIP